MVETNHNSTDTQTGPVDRKLTDQNVSWKQNMLKFFFKQTNNVETFRKYTATNFETTWTCRPLGELSYFLIGLSDSDSPGGGLPRQRGRDVEFLVIKVSQRNEWLLWKWYLFGVRKKNLSTPSPCPGWLRCLICMFWLAFPPLPYGSPPHQGLSHSCQRIEPLENLFCTIRSNVTGTFYSLFPWNRHYCSKRRTIRTVDWQGRGPQYHSEFTTVPSHHQDASQIFYLLIGCNFLINYWVTCTW